MLLLTVDCLQVTTLLSRYDKALASAVVSEQQLQQLQQQVSNQGSVLRAAKEAAKAAAGDADSKAQVTSGAHLQCSPVIFIHPYMHLIKMHVVQTQAT